MSLSRSRLGFESRYRNILFCHPASIVEVPDFLFVRPRHSGDRNEGPLGERHGLLFFLAPCWHSPPPASLSMPIAAPTIAVTATGVNRIGRTGPIMSRVITAPRIAMNNVTRLVILMTVRARTVITNRPHKPTSRPAMIARVVTRPRPMATAARTSKRQLDGRVQAPTARADRTAIPSWPQAPWTRPSLSTPSAVQFGWT